MTYTDLPEAATRVELERIVGSPLFEDSERLVRFLTFVVEQKLAGNASGLKESVIGVEVFGRPAGYDPKVDPIVRVQARRLRAKLDSWYLEGGRESAVRITLPKGGYVPEFALPAPVPEMPQASTPSPRPSPIRRIAWLSAAAALVIIATALVLIRSNARPTAARTRLFTAYPGYQTTPAFSPDGLTLAFAWGGPNSGAKSAIYVQSLNADAPRRLTNSSQRDRNPVWLADGQHIAFLRDDGPDQFAVMEVQILGGGEKRVATISGDLTAPPRIDISRDGTKLFASEAPSPGEPSRIVEIDIASGARRWVTEPVRRGPAAGTPGDDDVHLSADGKWLAFRRRTASAVGDVWIAPVSGGEARAITSDRVGLSGLAWARDGESLIVSTQRQSGLVRLWRFPLHGGAPVCLTDTVLSASYPAVNPRDGQIAFASRFLDTNLRRIDLRGGATEVMLASNLLESSPRYSPRGDRIAFRSNRTGSDEIWTADAEGRSAVRLTSFGGPVTGSPRWSPDGQHLAFDSRPEGSADIFLIQSGGGAPRRVTKDPSNEVTPAFSADGRLIYFASDRTGAWQVWRQDLDGAEPRQVTTAGGFAPQESPDGEWLYYTKLNTGKIFRVPVKGGPEAEVLDRMHFGLWGGWGLAGRKLVYIAMKGDAAELRGLDPETGKTEVLAELAHAPAQWDGSVGVSPDGRYVLVAEVERQGSEIHLLTER